jgi:aspartyl aminopeptidase
LFLCSIDSGAADEFISSARLDNLCMSFCSLEALLSTLASLGTDSLIRVVTLFDHEEVGSDSAQGAGSNMMHTLFTRISGADRVHSAIRKSMLVSADMAHACHPNYPEKHEANHRPRMHEGLVFKFNAKQRYATDAVSSFILKEIARCRKVPVQHFCVRNDVGCGSTIGPILASNTGIRVIDVGVPQFAMHSIRELCAVDDVAHAVDLLAGFFEDFASIDNNLKVD